jgi:magnesium-transporting ATPase (P-type)
LWRLEGDPGEIALAVSALKTHFTRRFVLSRPTALVGPQMQALSVIVRVCSFFEDEIGMDLSGVFEFDSDRKRMSVLYALREGTVNEGPNSSISTFATSFNVFVCSSINV